MQTLTSPTLDATNDEDPSSRPGSLAGAFPSPIFRPANDEDPLFRNLDDDDSDQLSPLPPDYDGGDDSEGDHIMTDATRTSSRIEKVRLEKLQAASAKPASPEPAGWKKGKGRKRGKMIKSKNAVERDEEDGEAVKAGDKRARPYKNIGVARGKEGKRPRLDEGPDLEIREDGDGSTKDKSGNEKVFWEEIELGNSIVFWEEIEQDLFVGKFILLHPS